MSEKKMNLQKNIRKRKMNDIKKFFKEYHTYVSQDPENRHDLFLWLKMNLLDGLSGYEKQELSSDVVPLSKLRELYELLAYIFEPLTASPNVVQNPIQKTMSYSSLPNNSFCNAPNFIQTGQSLIDENMVYGNSFNNYSCYGGHQPYYNFDSENMRIAQNRTNDLIARTACSLNSEGEDEDNDDNNINNEVNEIENLTIIDNQYKEDDYELNTPDVKREDDEENNTINDDIITKYKEVQKSLENLEELKNYLNDKSYTKSVFDFNDESNEPILFKMVSHMNEYSESLGSLHSENRINIFIKSATNESVFSRLISQSPEELKNFLHFLKKSKLKKETVDFCSEDKMFQIEMKKQKKEYGSDHSKLVMLNSIEYFCFNRAKP